MPDESTRVRKSTAVPHSGAQPPIPELEPRSDAAPRPPFNDPLPRATNESEARSPSHRPAGLDEAY